MAYKIDTDEYCESIAIYKDGKALMYFPNDEQGKDALIVKAEELLNRLDKDGE